MSLRKLENPEVVAGAHAAWRRLCPAWPEPTAVEVLVRKKKTAVCRLLGPAGSGFPVIAKRARRRSARVERNLHERILPRLSVGSLDWHGMVEEEQEESCWLFLEDAGDDSFSPERHEHRVLAAEWLAALHTADIRIEDAAELRESGAREALEQLRVARERILASSGDPALGAGSRDDLDAILRFYDAIERRWGECEALCAEIPRTLVHGDFAKKNLRVRERDGAPELLVFDWEHAGVGFPGIDLFLADEARYASRVRERWSEVDDGMLAQLFRIGRLFRCLIAIFWESRCLGLPAGTSREVRFTHLAARLGCAVGEAGWVG